MSPEEKVRLTHIAEAAALTSQRANRQIRDPGYSTCPPFAAFDLSLVWSPRSVLNESSVLSVLSVRDPICGLPLRFLNLAKSADDVERFASHPDF